MHSVIVRNLGRREYEPTWRAMEAFTIQRGPDADDELWLVEHPPVFTQGRNGKPEHILDAGDIPIVPVDRGGQVTYHGPGQVVIYPLIDLQRLGIGVRELVTRIEQAVIVYLHQQGIEATARADAPGVYVNEQKIAALGLRIKRGCSYHGLSFNVDMDLSPFTRINPCGYADLTVTQLKDQAGGHGVTQDWQQAAEGLCRELISQLGYTRRIEGKVENHVYNPESTQQA